MASFEDFLSEGKKLQIKRKYTENHPAKTVGKTANVRNAVLRAIKDGVVTREEFNKILSELSADSRQWSSRNRKYFNISEEGIKLSKWGMRILNELDSEEEEMILSDEISENVKVLKDKWPYVEFKLKGKKHKVDFEYEDEIDDHGNEGKDLYYRGQDEDGNFFEVDVYADSRGEVQDVLYDTLVQVEESVVNEKVEPGKYSGLYYDTAEKVFKRERIKVGWALIDKWLQKAHDEGYLEYTAEYVRDAEKDIRAAIDKIGKKNMKMFAYESNVNEKKLKFKVGDFIKKKKKYGGGALSYEIKSIKPKFNAVELYLDVTGNSQMQTFQHIEKEWELAEATVNEKDDAGTHLDNLESIVGKARDFFAIGKELDKGGYKKKYFYSDTMMPSYTIEVDGFKFAIINKKYVDKGDREVGDIAIGLLENMNTNMENKKLNEAKELAIGEKGVDYNDNVVEVIAIDRYRKIAQMFKKEMKADAEDYGFEETVKGDYYLTKNIESEEGNVGDLAIYPVKYDFSMYWGLDPVKESFNLFESFGDFLNAKGILNEAINSSILRSVLSNGREGKQGKKNLSMLAKGFYGLSKVALDKIEDEDFIVSKDPQKIFKNYGGSNHVIFFISDNEKENPYYDTRNSSWNDYKMVPGGGIVLAAMSGDRQFYRNEWSRWSGGRVWSKDKKGDEGQIGINHKYRGWGASGLNNGKRIAEMSDRVIVINLDLIRQKYSTDQLRKARAEAKAGATAFKSDKEFRDANTARYHKILADKAASLPLDKMVKDAIELLAKQISDGLAKGEKTQYQEIKIGESPKGREVKARDASQHMSNILDDYARYVDYIRQAEESEARYGTKETYYERESKSYAKRVKEKIDKIEKFDYAW